MFYGVVHRDWPFQCAESVCDVLGRGKNGMAAKLLLETCAQETHMGAFRDANFLEHGVGCLQFDKIGHKDVVRRARIADVELVKARFGFDLREVRHKDLAFNVLSSFVFGRIFYKLVPEEIPLTLEGRAQYWKTYYNTAAGKGTPAEYVKNAKRFLP